MYATSGILQDISRISNSARKCPLLQPHTEFIRDFKPFLLRFATILLANIESLVRGNRMVGKPLFHIFFRKYSPLLVLRRQTWSQIFIDKITSFGNTPNINSFIISFKTDNIGTI